MNAAVCNGCENGCSDCMTHATEVVRMVRDDARFGAPATIYVERRFIEDAREDGFRVA